MRVRGPSKRPSSGQLHPVSSVKERYRKGGKCKISRVLQSPFSSTQASPEVEASHRLKQAQHFSMCRKVQNENSRVHQDLPDSRGMGIVDRPIGRLPSHPHPPKLKEIPKVLPQISGVPVHLPPFQTGHGPQVFKKIVKEVKLMALSRGLHQYLDDWLIRSQSQEEALVNTQAVVDLLGVDHKSRKIRFTVDADTFLELLFLAIRGEAIKFSSYLKKQRNKTETQLITDIENLEKLTIDSNLHDNILSDKKAELEKLRDYKIRGEQVSSRIQWLQQGEKPSKYFCNLENHNFGTNFGTCK